MRARSGGSAISQGDGDLMTSLGRGHMPTIQQLMQTIDDRLGYLSREITALEGARAVLVPGGAKPKVARPSRPRSRPAVGPSARRRTSTKMNVLGAETAEHLLTESDGVTTAALAERAGAMRDQVLDLLRKLESAGRVRRTGQRRGTRWHWITDDDRVRERAAELEARRG
jgi:hypothetical protein